MAWYDEAVFYHIYPLGLLGAPKQNEYKEAVHRFRELDKWIDHICEIGCNAIYIGPLFESVGHGYETTDYRKLDSRLGDNEDLKNFVKNCHKKGIRVIFDGVFNHTGRDFFAFRDIKENRENSRYRDWYCNVNFYGNNEYNDGFSYDNWGGYNLLAKLNQRNPEVRDYICDVIRFWVSEFDVDGIRLDAADVLDFEFMKALRATAELVKPEFWLMGEVIHGDYTRWVNEGTLHSVTNYTLHKALYSGCNDHNFFEIAHTVKRLYGMGGNRPDGLKLYNFCDNHDVERIITKLTNKKNYTPVQILMYTLPGVPSIYYGSEFGIEGKKERGSDDSLRPYLNPDDYKNAVTDNDCTKLIRRLGIIRQNSKVLSYGDYRENSLTNRQYVYTRNTAGDTAIIAVNNDENPCTVYSGGIRDGEYVGCLSGKKVSVNGGNFSADIDANSGEIFVLTTSECAKKLGDDMTIDFTEIVPIKKSVMPEFSIRDMATEADEISYDKTPDNAEDKDEKAENSAEAENDVVINNIEAEVKDEKAAESDSEGAIKAEEKDTQASEKAAISGAALKYGIDAKYSKIDPDAVKARSDYENMTIEELQVAILEKMSGNGYIDNPMIKTVMDNEHQGSLLNWVRSFH